MKWREQLGQEHIAARSGRWAFWALPIAILAIIVTVLTARWTVGQSEELARSSGALDKPRPQLYVAGAKVESNLPLYFGGRFAPEGVTAIQLPLVLRNDGNKTVKGGELMIREPRWLAIDNEFLQQTFQSRKPVANMPTRFFVVAGNFAYVSFSLPDMHPGQTIGLSEVLRLTATSFDDTVDAVTKDGYTVNVPYQVSFSFPVTVSIAGEDLRTENYELTMHGLNALSTEQLRSAVGREIQRQGSQYRRQLGFWRYWLAHLARSREEQSVLIYPEYRTTIVNGKTVELPQGVQSIERFTYTIP